MKPCAKSELIIEGCGPSFVSVRAKRNKNKKAHAKAHARAKKAAHQAVSDEDVARLSGGECHRPKESRPKRFLEDDRDSSVEDLLLSLGFPSSLLPEVSKGG